MFKLNFNRADRNALLYMLVLMIAIVILGVMNARSSNYQPRPITIKTVSEKSLFDLKSDLECTPGSGKKDSPYTVGLTPGGLCDAQKLVGEHAGYEIADGIGGSLI
jgi:hypothetical protein